MPTRKQKRRDAEGEAPRVRVRLRRRRRERGRGARRGGARRRRAATARSPRRRRPRRRPAAARAAHAAAAVLAAGRPPGRHPRRGRLRPLHVHREQGAQRLSAALVPAVIYTVLFIPFTYAIDRFAYRRYQAREQGGGRLRSGSFGSAASLGDTRLVTLAACRPSSTHMGSDRCRRTATSCARSAPRPRRSSSTRAATPRSSGSSSPAWARPARDPRHARPLRPRRRRRRSRRGHRRAGLHAGGRARPARALSGVRAGRRARPRVPGRPPPLRRRDARARRA